MNKKAFIGATLITATVVGGVVYYRHWIRDQVDKWLGPDPEAGETREATPDEVALIERILDRTEQEGYLTGAQMHEKYPDKFDERGRLIRKQEPTA